MPSNLADVLPNPTVRVSESVEALFGRNRSATVEIPLVTSFTDEELINELHRRGQFVASLRLVPTSELQAEIDRRAESDVRPLLDQFSSACARTEAPIDTKHWMTVFSGAIRNLVRVHGAIGRLNIDGIKKYAAYKKLPVDPTKPIIPDSLLFETARDTIVWLPDAIAFAASTDDASNEEITFFRALHALLGIVSDVDELLEAFVRPLIVDSPGAYGRTFDVVNIKEEIGDVLYYLDRLASVFGLTLTECITANIAKLEKRYRGSFSETAANNRDITAERIVLEGTGTHRTSCGTPNQTNYPKSSDVKDCPNYITPFPVLSVEQKDYLRRAWEAGTTQSAGNTLFGGMQTEEKRAGRRCNWCQSPEHDTTQCPTLNATLEAKSVITLLPEDDAPCTYCGATSHIVGSCPLLAADRETSADVAASCDPDATCTYCDQPGHDQHLCPDKAYVEMDELIVPPVEEESCEVSEVVDPE